MKSGRAGMIHALEFGCEAPRKFYEHCVACPRFTEDCPDLALGREILSGKKKVVYNGEFSPEVNVDAKAFNCLASLAYFEKSRKNCGHQGRCREEGLLLALLDGKKKLAYSQKAAVQLPILKRRQKKLEVLKGKAQKAT